LGTASEEDAMPFMILYGGELAFAFLAARIAHWMWRSRDQVLALWRDRHGTPAGGPSFEPDPVAARPTVVPRRAPPVPSAEVACLRLAA
jgi:hypothetical protein